MQVELLDDARVLSVDLQRFLSFTNAVDVHDFAAKPLDSITLDEARGGEARHFLADLSLRSYHLVEALRYVRHALGGWKYDDFVAPKELQTLLASIANVRKRVHELDLRERLNFVSSLGLRMRNEVDFNSVASLDDESWGRTAALCQQVRSEVNDIMCMLKQIGRHVLDEQSEARRATLIEFGDANNALAAANSYFDEQFDQLSHTSPRIKQWMRFGREIDPPWEASWVFVSLDVFIGIGKPEDAIRIEEIRRLLRRSVDYWKDRVEMLEEEHDVAANKSWAFDETAAFLDDAALWTALAKPGFQPKSWVSNAESIAPLHLENVTRLNADVRRMFDDLYRAYIFGLWLAVAALARAVLEKSIADYLRSRQTVDLADMKLSEMIDAVQPDFPDLWARMLLIKDRGNKVLHFRADRIAKRGKSIDAEMHFRNSATEILKDLVLCVEALYAPREPAGK